MNAKFQRPRISESIAGEAEFHASQFDQNGTGGGRWRWIDLTLSLGLAGLLGFSWVWPRSRAIWNQVDATIFRFSNGALSFEWWRNGWAYLNHYYCDWIGLALYGMLLVYAGMAARRSWRRSALSICLLALVLIGCRGACGVAVKYSGGALNRPSPTLANSDALMLSELVPAIPSKDSSPWSFPSDHGFFVLAIILYLGYRGPDRAIRIGMILAPVFVIPRFVSGAHWFTDVAIGSSVMALVATALLMATPFHDWALDRIDRSGRTLRQRTTSRARQAAAAVVQTAQRPLRRRTAAPAAINPAQSGS